MPTSYRRHERADRDGDPGQGPGTGRHGRAVQGGVASQLSRPCRPYKIPGLKLPSLGSAPSSTARVVCDRPVGDGLRRHPATDSAAKGLAEHLGSTFAEAEGVTLRQPEHPGRSASPDRRRARRVRRPVGRHQRPPHVHPGGGRLPYRLRRERTARPVACSGWRPSVGPMAARPVINGFVCGIVTNNNDPKKMGRVKLAFPVFSNAFEIGLGPGGAGRPGRRLGGALYAGGSR